MQRFTEREYAVLTTSLDTAFDVFRRSTRSDAAAEAALREFFNNHYFNVWRAMAPPVPNGTGEGAA